MGQVMDYRCQYFLCKEFNITSPLMLAWHIVFKFALNPESIFPNCTYVCTVKTKKNTMFLVYHSVVYMKIHVSPFMLTIVSISVYEFVISVIFKLL